jgi:hypothetical protein
MNVEQTLTDELRVVADTVTAPPPPAVTALVQQAAGARTRSRVRWAATTFLAAAAVVAAVVVGNQWGRTDSTPQPVGPTPTATPTPETFPTGNPLATFVDERGTLYVAGVAEAGSWSGATTEGDLTLGFSGAPAAVEVTVFIGTEPVGTIDRTDDSDNVKVSPDRRTIAWVRPEGTVGSIVVARVSPNGIRELGRLTVATLLLGNDDERKERLMAVADDGTVTYGGVLGGHAWTPGSAPRSADISSYEYGPRGFPCHGQEVVLNPSGTWGAWLAAPAGTSNGFAQFTAVGFQQTDRPETRTRIAMPRTDADLRGLYWESDTDVVLTVFDPTTTYVHYVRCNVVDRACEYAPTPTTP